MITNDGKEVLSKYLMGQAPSYATHIAIGCGAKPLETADSLPESFANKKFLDFEMLRIPISSRGLVEENGNLKIALTAEIPTENRYEISEIGLWSAANNSLAKGFDSRILFDFQEPWQIHDTTIRTIEMISPLGTGASINDQGRTIFFAEAKDPVLQNTARKNRQEGIRFLNKAILIRGDSSKIEGENGLWTSSNVIYEINNKRLNNNIATLTTSVKHSLVAGRAIVVEGVDSTFDGTHTITSVTEDTFSYTKIADNVASSVVSPVGNASTESTHIHLNNISFSIGRNSPADILTLAFSVLNADAIAESGNPDFVKILIEFFRNEVSTQVGFAKIEIYLDQSDLDNNRYKAVSVPISELITTADFTASEIRLARIFAYVEKDGTPSPDYYVALDGFRLENITTDNPLYKMVGYSVIKNNDQYPIIKFNNTNSYIEFRFGLGVS
jgi:hypothetical protein